MNNNYNDGSGNTGFQTVDFTQPGAAVLLVIVYTAAELRGIKS